MSAFPHEVVMWLDRRLDELLAAPRMWGSMEAVEMQVLLLLEARWVALHDNPARAEPRHVFDAYLRHLNKMFPGSAPQPLFAHVGHDDFEQLAKGLAAFRALLTSLGTADIVEPAPKKHEDANVVELDAELRAFHQARRKMLEGVVKGSPALARELHEQGEAVRHVLEDLPEAVATEAVAN